MKRTVENPDGTYQKEDGTFSSKDVITGLHYAYCIGTVSLGAGLNYIYSNYDNDVANGVSVNLGILYKTPVKDLLIGVSGKNILGTLNYNEGTIPLPLATKFGVSYGLFNRILVMYGDFKVTNYTFPSAHTGIEVNLFDIISLRTGYKYAFSGNNPPTLGWLSGLSAGLGLNFKYVGLGIRNICVDYAFVPYGDLGTTHRISLELILKNKEDDVEELYKN